MPTTQPRPSWPCAPSPPPGLGPDATIRWYAARQFDVVGRRQLLEAGLSGHEVTGRASRGVLLTVHRGVFRTSAAPMRHESRLFAALLAGPPGAVISHRSAAVHRGLLPETRGPVHLTSAGPQHPRADLVVHRSRSQAATATIHLGIPCTSTARTLVDVAGVEGGPAAERAWSTLSGRRALRPAAVETELRRFRHRSGAPQIRRLLERHRLATTGHTRSQLEAAALAMCARHGLPTPHVNRLIHADDEIYEADLLWERPRLIVELDDWSTHGAPDGFRGDRERDFDLDLSGWKTVRLLHHDVTADAARTAERLRRLFARRLTEVGGSGVVSTV